MVQEIKGKRYTWKEKGSYKPIFKHVADNAGVDCLLL
jgi:hypothetical protein